jgi:hypothetical protein
MGHESAIECHAATQCRGVHAHGGMMCGGVLFPLRTVCPAVTHGLPDRVRTVFDGTNELARLGAY